MTVPSLSSSSDDDVLNPDQRKSVEGIAKGPRDRRNGSLCIYFDKEEEAAADKLNSRHFASDDELEHFDLNEMRLDLTELQAGSSSSSEEAAAAAAAAANSVDSGGKGRTLFRTYDDIVRSKNEAARKGTKSWNVSAPFSASMDNIYDCGGGDAGKVRALTKYFDHLEAMKRRRRRRAAGEDENGDHSTLQKFIGGGGAWKSEADLVNDQLGGEQQHQQQSKRMTEAERREILAQLQEWSEFGTRETEEHSYRVQCRSAVVDERDDGGGCDAGMSLIVKITPEEKQPKKCMRTEKEEEEDCLGDVDEASFPPQDNDQQQRQRRKGPGAVEAEGGDDDAEGGGDSLVIIDPTNLWQHFQSRESLPNALVVQRPETCPHAKGVAGKVQFNNPVTVNYHSSATTTTVERGAGAGEAGSKPSPRSRLLSFLTMRQVKRKKGKPTAVGGGRISRSETREASA